MQLRLQPAVLSNVSQRLLQTDAPDPHLTYGRYFGVRSAAAPPTAAVPLQPPPSNRTQHSFTDRQCSHQRHPEAAPSFPHPYSLPWPLDGNSLPQRDHFINYRIRPGLSHTCSGHTYRGQQGPVFDGVPLGQLGIGGINNNDALPLTVLAAVTFTPTCRPQTPTQSDTDLAPTHWIPYRCSQKL